MLALVATATACGGTTSAPAAHPNVILITIDTLRADRLQRGLTPSIDALAATGARFVNARSVVPLTLPSHVTIMTGALPAVHGVHDNGVVFKPGPAPLARVFKDAGYRTAAFVGAYVLNRRFGLSEGFDVYDDAVHRVAEQGARLEAERRGGEVVDAAIGWIAGAAAPLFLWVHLYDPHAPYEPPPEYLAKAGGKPYDGEVAYADAQVGRLLEALRSKGLLDGAIVAVAGDHGEGLGDHGEQTHGMLAYDSTLKVPLVVVAPGLSAAAVIADHVSLVDLAGTLANAAHVRPGPAMGGWFLFSRKPPDRDVYAETEYPRAAGWHPLHALVDDRFKLIVSSEPELYDVSSDAGETQNLAPAKASLVGAMSKRILTLSQPAAGAASPGALAPEAAERLRALGYVGGSTPAPAADGGVNPASVIQSWVIFENALSQMNDGKSAAALPALKALAARFPDAPLFQSTYARALKDTGKAKEAVAIYRQAVARWPADATLYHDLAVAARAAGDVKEALRAEQAALAISKDDPMSLNGAGLLQIEAGQAAEAVKLFERAAEGDPSNASYWTNLGNARRELGDMGGAETAYRRALDADSSFADALNGLGVLLVQGKRPGEAIPLFERALVRSPDFHEARLNLGIAYQESGQREKAVAVYRELLVRAPAGSRERSAAAALLKGQ